MSFKFNLGFAHIIGLLYSIKNNNECIWNPGLNSLRWTSCSNLQLNTWCSVFLVRNYQVHLT